MVWLVLQRDREDRQPFRCVCRDPAPEVLGERSVKAREQSALDETPGRFHPARRAPRTADELELRIDRDCALERGNFLGAVDIDREMRQRRIRFAGWTIVVAVMRAREI